jgi:hypothetical protein
LNTGTVHYETSAITVRFDKVYLFHGQNDEVVNYGILEKIVQFYRYFITDGDVFVGKYVDWILDLQLLVLANAVDVSAVWSINWPI